MNIVDRMDANAVELAMPVRDGWTYPSDKLAGHLFRVLQLGCPASDGRIRGITTSRCYLSTRPLPRSWTFCLAHDQGSARGRSSLMSLPWLVG
jgi:hypothetical protein